MTENQKLDVVLEYFKKMQHNIAFDRNNKERDAIVNKFCNGNFNEYQALVDTITNDAIINRSNVGLFITTKGNSFKGYESAEIEKIKIKNKEFDLLNNNLRKSRFDNRIGNKISIMAIIISIASFMYTMYKESCTKEVQALQRQMQEQTLDANIKFHTLSVAIDELKKK